MKRTIYDHTFKTLDGDLIPLERYRGSVLLIVNTASRCGYTPQYAGLEALHRALEQEGFSVLGFPCNQFGRQEPGSHADIAEFCRKDYDVTFPLHEKIDVNGPAAHPLFVQLKDDAPGLFGTGSIKWNFTKFLVNRRGEVVRRFGSTTTPESLRAHVLALLREK